MIHAWSSLLPTLLLLGRPLAAVKPNHRAETGVQRGLGRQKVHLEVAHNGAVNAAAQAWHEPAPAIRREPHTAGRLGVLLSGTGQSHGHQAPLGSQPYPQAGQQGGGLLPASPSSQPLRPPPIPLYGQPPLAAPLALPPQSQSPLATQSASGPSNLNEAVQEANKFDNIVVQAEKQAGLPDSVHTTTVFVLPDEEMENGQLTVLWVVLSIAVILGGGALGYSWYIYDQAAKLEAQLKAPEQ